MSDGTEKQQAADISATVTERTPASLKLRWASALILGPIGLWVVWQGGWLFATAVGLVAVLMAFEWTRLVHGEGVLTIFYVHSGISLSGIVLATLGMPGLGLLIVAVGSLIGAVVAFQTERDPAWSALGIVYTAFPCISILWIREGHNLGLEIVVSLLFVVWATDTGAYVVGKTIGGPKLVPKLSPGKTWAGLAGAVLCAAVFAAIAAYLIDLRPLILFAVMGALLAIVAQIGDIAESAVKRHFNAKDTSGFIPGHGGVLDRLDGLMFAVIIVALIVLAQGYVLS